jgi:hypothetical protein
MWNLNKHKYNAKPERIDGYYFDSQAEARRYMELKLLARAGEISDLGIHPCFELIVNDTKVGVIELDFEYMERGQKTVEDVKGVSLPLYILKRNLFKALFPNIKFIELKTCRRSR